jgi:NAD(P)H dehydrogenase (quinone)
MILITGATGHLGKATIEFLLQKGFPAAGIAALIRDEAKAASLANKGIQLRKGDYDNYASLLAAFAGVEKLLLISGNDIANRGTQQATAVKAAKEAGVKHILYTSFARKNETDSSPIAFVAKSHIDTEKAIKESGIPYTIFRNTLYMDYIPVFIGDKVVETGVYWPAGDAKAAVATREDMAEAIANVLASTGHEGKEYNISNTEKVSFADIAAIISDAAGKPVPYISPTQQEYIAALTIAGVPAAYIDMFAGFAEAIKQGEFENPSSDLATLLGRNPVSAAAYLTQVYTKN